MPKRKACQHSDGREDNSKRNIGWGIPRELYCHQGGASQLAPGESAKLRREAGPKRYVGHDGFSLGAIESPQRDPERRAVHVHHEGRRSQGKRHDPIEVGSSLELESGSELESDLEPESSPKPKPKSKRPAQPVEASYAPVEDEPTLSEEQQKVVDLILEGNNVFYTGSAGCGKSTILRVFVGELKEQGKTVRICAPTNLAALNVNGMTLWAYAGWIVPDAKKPLAALRQGAHQKKVWTRLNQTDVLVIDEISMCENVFFERLNELMKEARGSDEAFGGVQLVVTGDFCQLSPVKPFENCLECGGALRKEPKWRPTKYHCDNSRCSQDLFHDRDKWAFRSRAWKECNFEHINLTQIFRQSDEQFINILQKIRIDNEISPRHQKILLRHQSDTEGAVEIFPLRNDVERISHYKIQQLPSRAHIFQCKDFFNLKPHHREKQPELKKYSKRANDGRTLYELDKHRYEPELEFKKDMRVVLQHNLNPIVGLVNGSQGTIIGFERFDSRKLPTKSNGNERDDSEGAPSISGSHARYRQEQIKRYAEDNGRQPWPVVEFDLGIIATIYPECAVNEIGDSEPFSLLSRTQIPLMAGYAITVHKAQGMTLERVKVNLAKAFEPSQVYVALSRATSLEGLEVTALPKKDLGGANEQVKRFFDKYLRVDRYNAMFGFV